MKKLLLSVTLSLLCFVGTLHATTVTATTTGQWSSPSTWLNGVIPSSTDTVIIPQGITVTMEPATDNPGTGFDYFNNTACMIVAGELDLDASSEGGDGSFNYVGNLFVESSGTFNVLPTAGGLIGGLGGSNFYFYAGSTTSPNKLFYEEETGNSNLYTAIPFTVAFSGSRPNITEGDPSVPMPSFEPVIYGQSVSNITSTSATVNVEGYTMGFGPSSTQINYGTDASLGSSVVGGNVAASNSPVAFTTVLSGLNPSTIYDYRPILNSPQGSIGGALQIFTTGAVVQKIWTPGAGIYTPNKVLTFTVWWTNTNQGPLVANTTGGTPYLPITIGGVTEKAYLDSVSVLNLNAYFSYSVTASDIAQGISIGPNIILNGGTLDDKYGTPVDLSVSSPIDPMPTNSSGTPILSLIYVGPYPIVYTQPATSIGETTATLNGNVNDDGYNTGTAFEYSTSPSGPYNVYPASPASVNAGAGATGISAPLVGLDSGTVYYFLAQGTNAIGSVTGDTLSFATGTYTQSVWVNAPGTYQTGNALNFTVNYKQTYSTGLIVTGAPYLTLQLASGTVNVPLQSASGNSLLFSYTVAAGDNAPTGIGLGSFINLNGGTITDSAGTPVSLYLNNVSDTADILVDGTAPQLVSIVRENPTTQNITDAASPVTFQVNFNKGVKNVSTASFIIESVGAAGTITSVTPSANGASYDVVVSNLSGAGDLNIALSNTPGITDSLGLTLATSSVIIPQYYSISTQIGLTGANGQITWYAQGSASQAITIAPNIVATDVGGNIISATISIGSGLTSGDQLNFTNTAGITGSYNAATGTLTLTGNGTPAQWTTALESITFINTSSNIPVVAANNRKVYFQIQDDASGVAGGVQQDINVIAGFTLSNSTFTLSACQNGAAVDFSSQLGVLDYSTTDQLTYTSLVAPTQGTLSGLPATISANGSTVTPSNIFYTPNAGATGTDQFTLNVSNGTQTIPVNFTVTINAAPNAGSITAPASLCQGPTGSQLTETVSGGVWSTTTSSLVNVSSTGLLTGLTGGSGANVTYTVTDGNGCSAATVATVNITTTPVITLTPSTAQTISQEGSEPFSVTYDASTTNLEWTYSGTGGSINGGGASTGWLSTASGSAATLSLSGTATSGTLTVGAENGCGTSTQSVNINVNSISLTINTTGSTSGIAGNAMSFSFGTTGGNGTYTYTNTGTLPPGLTFVNGVVTGTPSQVGSFTEKVTSTDGSGATQSLNYTITVGAPNLGISPSSLPSGSYGTPYVGAQITASGGTAPYTYSANGLPAGMTIDPTTGMITGTPTAAGSFYVSVTAQDATTGIGAPYSVTIFSTLNISQATLTITANNATMVYGGTFPTFTLSYSGWLNGDGPSSLTTAPVITTSASPFSGVGNYALIPSGAVDPNYTIVYVNGNLSITPAALTVTASDESMVYGSGSLPALAVTYSGWVNGDGPASLTTAATATTTATAASPVGTYTITPSGAVDPNYTITYVTGTLTITPATLTVTASDESMVYGSSSLPALGVTYSGWVNGDGPASLTTAATATTTATTASPVGTYPITPSGAVDPNYTITYVTGTLTITPATLTVTASDESMVYGSSSLPALGVTYSGWVNGDGPASLTTAATATTTATTASPVGTYPITPSGAVDPNYTITYVTGTLTITPATLTVTASNESMVYGSGSLPALAVTYSGWVNGDGPASLTTAASATTTATVTSPVGTYPITPSGAVDPNYTITYVTGTLTITPATLTVTATDESMVYGSGSLPALAVTYSGWVNGDGPASLTTAATATTTATAASPVGTYPITPSGAVDPNYTITYVPGTLTITPATLTVTASDESMVYGSSSLPALGVTYSGWVNGDGPASLTTAAIATTTATAASPVGNYPITPTGAVDPNYTITYVNGTLSITQAALTITASNASMTYGGTVPNLTYTYSGWLNGDGPSSLTTAPTVSTTATSSSNVGTYPITVSGAVISNYTVTYVSGTLTINPATLLVTATSLSRYYNTPNPTLTFTYSGFVLGQTSSVITDAPSISTTAVQSSLPGQYPITLSGGTAPNYVFTYQDGVLTVIQSLNNVITFDALAQKTYGDPDFVIAATASSGLAVRFVSADPSIATVYNDNGTWMVHIVSAGTVNIEAFQDGDGQYGAATEVDQPLVINKANQTIVFQAPSNSLTTGQVITLNATASSGLPITYTISDPSMATLNGNQLVITGTGSFTITANQAGDEDYNPAAPVSYTINTFNSAGFTGGIGLFPNPAHGTTHLRFSIDYLITKYSIYSIDGRCVQNQSMVTNNSNDIEVNVAGLASGYYLVHVACVENHVVKDLVFKLLVY